MQEPEDMEASTSNQPDRLTQVLGPERHDYVSGIGLGPTPAIIWGTSIYDDIRGEHRSVRFDFCYFLQNRTEPIRLSNRTELTHFSSVFQFFRLGQFIAIISCIFNHHYIIIL